MAVPKKRSVAALKSTILNSAQTSHFEVSIVLPRKVASWMRIKTAGGRGNPRISGVDFSRNDLLLSCHQASLPGSSFATHELTNKYQNNTVKNVYRKTFDQSTSFSFYVDKNYDILHFFENWMSYMMSEDANIGLPYLSYRAQWPDDYKTLAISITKFERDYRGEVMTYNFLDAYPASMDSMEVSYQGSQVLSCTVSFNYTRYITGSINMETNSEAVDDRDQEERNAQVIAAAATGTTT